MDDCEKRCPIISGCVPCRDENNTVKSDCRGASRVKNLYRIHMEYSWLADQLKILGDMAEHRGLDFFAKEIKKHVDMMNKSIRELNGEASNGTV